MKVSKEEIYKMVKDNTKNDILSCRGFDCEVCEKVFGEKLFSNHDYSDCSKRLSILVCGDSCGDKETIYLAGDLCKMGNVLLREKEASIVRSYPQLEVYSPIEDKEINDKSNQTVESNKYLCDKIYHKDLNAIRKSKYIIMDVDNNSVGTITELGAIAEFNWFHDAISNIINDTTDVHNREDVIYKIEEFLKKYPKKKAYFHNTDIRNTELQEQGFFRSYSLNQLSHGAIRYLNPNGIEKDFKTCVENIVRDIEEGK